MGNVVRIRKRLRLHKLIELVVTAVGYGVEVELDHADCPLVFNFWEFHGHLESQTGVHFGISEFTILILKGKFVFIRRSETRGQIFGKWRQPLRQESFVLILVTCTKYIVTFLQTSEFSSQGA